MAGQNEILGLNTFFLLNILSSRKQKAKDLNMIPKTRMHMDLSYIDLPLMVLNYFNVDPSFRVPNYF